MKKKSDAFSALTPQEARQALYNAFSLCRKAGKLVMGYDAVVDAVMTGKAGRVFLAADVSPKTAERLRFAVEGLADVEPLPLTQDDLAPVSHKRVAVFAVADANLARLCETKRKQCLDLDMKEEVSE